MECTSAQIFATAGSRRRNFFDPGRFESVLEFIHYLDQSKEMKLSRELIISCIMILLRLVTPYLKSGLVFSRPSKAKFLLFNNIQESTITTKSTKKKKNKDETTIKKTKIKSISISNMTEAIARQELLSLSSEIKKHDELYYTLNTPEITDSAYDKLRRRVIDIIGKYNHLKNEIVPDFDTVSGTPNSYFQSYIHTIPMLSLDNGHNYDDIYKFIQRHIKAIEANNSNHNTNNINHNTTMYSISDLSYVLEPKIDGLSLSIQYKNGHLFRAGTRGDGTTGEDVTDNVKLLTNIPHIIPQLYDTPYIEIRGEIYISKQDFITMNNIRQNNNNTIFSNTRNAAAGTLRLININTNTNTNTHTSNIAYRKLNFFAYHIHIPTTITTITTSSEEAEPENNSGLGNRLIDSTLQQALISQEYILNYLTTIGFSVASVPYVIGVEKGETTSSTGSSSSNVAEEIVSILYHCCMPY